MTATAVMGHELAWDGVSFDYGGADVLHQVSLRIEAGESVALLGPNGAGKTTLTRMLMGLIRPRVGRVTVGGRDVARRRPDEMAADVGYAFQHADQQLFARTVRDDVAFGPRRLGRAESAVDDALRELELEAVAKRHPYDLPAPVRKLVTLAGVFAMQTQALVLDEPTAGFDRVLRALVVAAVRRRTSAGVTILSVSHDNAFVAATANRTINLEHGRVAQ